MKSNQRTSHLRTLLPLLALAGPLAVRAAPEPVGPEVRLSLPETGRTIRRQKTWDVERRVHGITNRDEQGRVLSEQDLARLRAQEDQRRTERQGALEAGFAAEIAADPQAVYRVIAVAPLPERDVPRRPALATLRRARIEEVHAHKANHRQGVARAAEAPRETLEAVITGLGGRLTDRASLGPFVQAELVGEQILELARRPEVASIYRGGQIMIEDLANSTCAMGADAVQALGLTGAGVNVSVVEPSEVDGNLSCLNLQGTQNNAGVANHPTWVAGVIANTLNAQLGVAPGVGLFSGAVNGGSMQTMFDWSLNQGVDVINMSYTTAQTGTIQGDDVQVDFYVRDMATTIAKSAGNIGNANNPGSCFATSNVTSPGIGFNAITVGNLNDNNTCGQADDTMNAGSCFIDPQSPHDDREKPEVVAPGTAIVTINAGAANSCNVTGNGGVGGTSFSTPHVAGAAALMIERLPVLAFWPETIKALLMATAWYDVDGVAGLSDLDGAGGIDVSGADEAIREGRFTAEEWTQASFGSDRRRVLANVLVPWQTQRLKVALTWSTYGDTGQTEPTNDFDLYLEYAGAQVATSVSFDNNYEVIDLTNPTPGTYQIVAYLASGAMVDDDAASEYGAVAWGIVNPCADAGFDHDLDGVCSDDDNCDLDDNPGQEEGDGDGIGDVCDNCPQIKNADQADFDSDDVGDVCDNDWDGDGCLNGNDDDDWSGLQVVGSWFSFSCNPPSGQLYGEAGADSDNDGVLDCDPKETDNDDDGLDDLEDACPTFHDPENSVWHCHEFVDCPVGSWWDVCMLGPCNELLIQLVAAINPDPTIYQRFEIRERTLYLALEAGVTPEMAAEAFFDAGHAQLQVTDQRGRLVSMIADFSSQHIEIGDLSRGNALLITPIAEGHGLMIEAGEMR